MMSASSAARKIAIAQAFRQAYRSARASDATARRRSEEYLAQTLGRLKGLPQKVGQLLSLRGAAPEEGPLSSLSYAGFEPMPWSRVEAILVEEFDAPVAQPFAWVSELPLAAASLSQVHAARLHDGREVVVKVQYPGIWKAIWSDLEILGWIGLPFKGFEKRFRLDEYRKLILQNLSRELDYDQELEALRAFRRQVQSLGYVDIPEPIEELCSSHVLTMTRLEGASLAEVVRTWAPDRRSVLAERIVTLFMEGLTEGRLLHADPHPGNYRFVDSANGPRIVLYDFGCVRRLPEAVCSGLREILGALRRGEDRDWAGLLIGMGFDAAQIRPLATRLGEAMKVLFAPFVSSENFDVSTWRPSADVERLLGADRWALRTAAPPNFLFVMRGFHGILYYLRELGAPVNLSRLGASGSLSGAHQSQPNVGEEQRTPGARQLCVVVEENGEWKVRLFLPPDCARRLSEEMPSEVLARVREKNIDVGALEERYRQLEVLPVETVFELREGFKTIKVWLE